MPRWVAALQFVIPTEAYPDFLLRGTHQQPRVRLSVRESRMRFANATNLDRKSGVAKWSDCLFCQACEGWFGCGKDVDGVHLGNAAAFPTFPQRCGGWGIGI